MINSIESILKDYSIPWSTKAIMIYEFHESMIKKHGHRNHRHEFGWSIAETALAIKSSPSQVSKALTVGRMLKKNSKLKEKYNSLRACYEGEK